MLLAAEGAFAQTGADSAPPLTNNRDRASYVIGRNIGLNIRQNAANINVEALLSGIRDLLSGAPSRLTPEQEQAAMAEFQRAVQAQAEQLGERNKREGAAFLAKNATRPGIESLPSGLQYQVLQEGTGPSPTLQDTVRTHYHGTLINGTVFDSSVRRNEPAVFPVNAVIRGWTEALQLMRVGGKWRLFIPSQLAYGPQGAPPDIGPHAVLIFEVELLGIE